MNPIIKKDIQNIVKRLGARVSRFSGKTVLVTGGSGLIGSYIVETLTYLNDTKRVKKPAHIIALQKTPVVKGSRLGYLLDRSDVECIAHDVALSYTPTRKVDYIVHAAGMSAPAFFLANPLGTVDVNVSGIRWILEYAKNHPLRSILYMSSGEIYGDPTIENIPTPETYTGNVSTFGPRACYTSAKRLAETLCRIYFEKFNVPVKIARPFIVYGPGLPITDRRVMADFIRQGLMKKPIQMASAGLDTRSYCYIADATVAFFEILLSSENGEAFNVASDLEEVSIRNLAEITHKICRIETPVSVKIKDENFIKGAPHRVMPDISKLRKTFAYTPKVGISEGLKRIIAWNRLVFKKEIKSSVKPA